MKLDGIKIAISASTAPDSAQLGMPNREVDRALLTICTTLIRKGCEIIYLGNLSPSQYTFKIFRHLASAYAGARTKAPFLHVIAEPIARRSTFDRLHAALEENRSIAETQISIGEQLVPLRPSGPKLLLGQPGSQRISIANEEDWTGWLASHVIQTDPDAYTRARALVTVLADARLAIGGKMGRLECLEDSYEGAMPGIVQEAIMSLEAGQPFIPLGAYGGAARDVAIALGLLAKDRAVPRANQQEGYEQAIAHLAGLSSQVPSTLRPHLSQIADEDRGEPTSFAVIDAILQWREFNQNAK